VLKEYQEKFLAMLITVATGIFSHPLTPTTRLSFSFTLNCASSMNNFHRSYCRFLRSSLQFLFRWTTSTTGCKPASLAFAKSYGMLLYFK
jgi:hypothetical protein